MAPGPGLRGCTVDKRVVTVSQDSPVRRRSTLSPQRSPKLLAAAVKAETGEMNFNNLLLNLIHPKYYYLDL